MKDTELKQNADFLSIAMECLQDGSADVAADFIEDVADELDDENQADSLHGAVTFIEDDEIDEAYGIVSQVNEEILQDIENI